MVTRSPIARAVWIVKVTVTALLTTAGERSAAGMVIATPVTCIPIVPVGAPALIKSFVDETNIPVMDPAVGAPIVTPVKTRVYAVDARGPVDAAATTQVLPLTVVVVLKSVLPLAVGAAAAKKLAGQVMVTDPMGMAVAKVNVTLTVLVGAAATRSAAAISMETAVTCPPSTSTELTELTLRMSLVVATQKEEEHGCIGSPGVGPMTAVTVIL